MAGAVLAYLPTIISTVSEYKIRGVELKVKRQPIFYIKLFCIAFFRFTYSVFLRHSLDFDGVMW